MARGSFALFDEAKQNILKGSYDLDSTNWKMMLINALPNANQASPDSSNFTEVTPGGGYSIGGETINMLVNNPSAETVIVSVESPIVWVATGFGDPNNIVAGLIYNTDPSVTEDALGFIDMTDDGGSTPVSLLVGDLTISFPSNLFTLT